MDYRKNYLKIYFWQSISVLLGFAALFVVVPFISANKPIYGIYSVCTSLTIFFSYADLGFLSSGVKFAAESFIRGEHREEIRIIGFTSFIMVGVFALLAMVLVVLGLFPKLLIPELTDGSEQMHIARWLLFTLAVSCPIIIGQRLMGLVFTIRVEDYKFQRLNICGNIIRILLVLFFFGGGRYMIIEYYVFYQIVNLIIVLMALLYARKHYGYGIKSLISSFKFDKEIFDKVKGLTGASLVMMMCSVLFYELDQIVISNIIGIEAVACYAVALSAMQLVRTMCGIVYSPYTSRYNHFVGLKDYDGLTHFVKKMIVLFAPIIIIPVLTLSLSSEPFVISWVGEQYFDSAFLVSFLALSFIFNFVKEPINQFLVATERNRVLVKYNILSVVIYWMGIIILVSSINTKAFAIMKFVAPLSTLVAYWMIAEKDFQRIGKDFLSIKRLLLTVAPVVATVFIYFFCIRNFMIVEPTQRALLINISFMGLIAGLSFLTSIPFNGEIRGELYRYYHKLVDRKNIS